MGTDTETSAEDDIWDGTELVADDMVGAMEDDMGDGVRKDMSGVKVDDVRDDPGEGRRDGMGDGMGDVIGDEARDELGNDVGDGL